MGNDQTSIHFKSVLWGSRWNSCFKVRHRLGSDKISMNLRASATGVNVRFPWIWGRLVKEMKKIRWTTKKGENSETSLNCSTDSTGCNSFASRSALLPAVHGDDSFAAMSTLCHVQQATKSLKKSLKKVISIDSYWLVWSVECLESCPVVCRLVVSKVTTEMQCSATDATV